MPKMKNFIILIALFIVGCASKPFSDENDVAQKELEVYLSELTTVSEVKKALKKKKFKCKSVSPSKYVCTTKRIVAPLVCSKEGWRVELIHREEHIIANTIRYQYPACL